MATKRRTKAEIEADTQSKKEEFIRLYDAFKASHTPEDCSCIQNRVDQGDPMFPNALETPFLEKRLEEFAKMKELGVKEYVWRCGMREYECERCQSYDGKIFSYDNPPPGGHPGLVPGCDCGASPLMNFKKIEQPDAKPRRKLPRWAKILVGVTLFFVFAYLNKRFGLLG